MWNAESRPCLSVYPLFKSLRNLPDPLIGFTPEAAAELIEIFNSCFLCGVALNPIAYNIQEVLFRDWGVDVISTTDRQGHPGRRRRGLARDRAGRGRRRPGVPARPRG